MGTWKGDLSNLGIEARSLTLQVESLSSEPPGKPIPTRDLPNPYGVEFLKTYVGCIPVAGNERRREGKRERAKNVFYFL